MQHTLQDAKNKFSEVVRRALDGEPQLVTRSGRPAVVVVSVEEYERLRRCEGAAAGTFIEHLLSIPPGEDFIEPGERAQVVARDVDL